MKHIAFIWNYIKPYRHQLILLFVDVVAYAFFMLAGPLIISFVVDQLIRGLPIEPLWLQQLISYVGGIEGLREHIWICSSLVVLVYVCTAIAIHFRSVHTGNLSETLAKNVRNTMYDHLQKLPFSYHKMKDSGDLIQRSTSDIETIRRFLASQLSEMMFAIINMTIATIILWNLNPKLTLFSVSLIPFILIASFLFFTKAKKIFLDCDIAESHMTTVLQENLNAMRVVKAFYQERKEIEKFEEHNEEYRHQYFKLMHALAIFWSCTDFLGQSQILLMVGCGIMMALQGELSVGTFFVFLMYEAMIVWPMRQLGRILADMGKVSVSISRICEVLQETGEDLTAGLTPVIKGNITFDHVCFQYEDDHEDTLHDITFSIEANTQLAIMGTTGSGKSSLIHLLNGIYPYQKGSITMDGVELKDIQKTWLRRHVQVVLQEPFLFSKTIYDNIHLASRTAIKEQVTSVAQMASIHDDIEAFDQGYDTLVGEKGVTLSGGQKQRVAIARTLLAESPIVIFDDSLSALDTKTDVMIQEALQQKHQDMTLIMITHRVQSAMKADKILVLEHGRQVQYGTHEELIQQQGLYQRIYKLQHVGGGDDE